MVHHVLRHIMSYCPEICNLNNVIKDTLHIITVTDSKSSGVESKRRRVSIENTTAARCRWMVRVLPIDCAEGLDAEGTSDPLRTTDGGPSVTLMRL